MITLQREQWREFYRDAQHLFPLHWEELAVNQHRIKPDCDVARYEQLDDAGIVLIVTARDGAKLAGYIVCFLMPHLHYKSAGPMALTDMYFVLPEYRRGVGARLFLKWESVLRELNIVQAITSCKVHQDHSKLFERMGWKHTDNTFVKLLEA